MRPQQLLFLLAFTFSSSLLAQHPDGQELIGKKAPEWHPMQWINSPALSLESLAGKVVLIRWWTNNCPFCEASAPALNEFYAKYRKQGLVVIGMYHPKPNPQIVSRSAVTTHCKRKGFSFPVALDNDWENLNNYWLDQVGRTFTSVSFLIDKQGTIRYIHSGGEYHANGKGEHAECRADYLDLKKQIETLLRKK